MPEEKNDKKLGKIKDFFVTGSFIMTLFIGVLVAYNQLQQRFQDERWATLKEQNIKIETSVSKMNEKLDSLSIYMTECKIKLETNTNKIDSNSKEIALLWENLKKTLKFWDKDEREHN